MKPTLTPVVVGQFKMELNRWEICDGFLQFQDIYVSFVYIYFILFYFFIFYEYEARECAVPKMYWVLFIISSAT